LFLFLAVVGLTFQVREEQSHILNALHLIHSSSGPGKTFAKDVGVRVEIETQELQVLVTSASTKRSTASLASFDT
jgi:hypothetical protein